jgi:hypothetical protein
MRWRQLRRDARIIDQPQVILLRRPAHMGESHRRLIDCREDASAQSDPEQPLDEPLHLFVPRRAGEWPRSFGHIAASDVSVVLVRNCRPHRCKSRSSHLLPRLAWRKYRFHHGRRGGHRADARQTNTRCRTARARLRNSSSIASPFLLPTDLNQASTIAADPSCQVLRRASRCVSDVTMTRGDLTAHR